MTNRKSFLTPSRTVTFGAALVASVVALRAYVDAHPAPVVETPMLVKQKLSLTLDGARTVLDAAIAHAKSKSAGGAIAIVDDGGHSVLSLRLDGTFAAGAEVSLGKARTSAKFKKPTKFFEDAVNGGRFTMVALPDFTPLQGGVPLVVDGEIVGAIGVSGAHSAAEDEEIAMAGAAALSGVTTH